MAHKHWYFIERANRDEYLANALRRGLKVRAKTLPHIRIKHWYIADHPANLSAPNGVYEGQLYTIRDVDQRKGS